MEQDDVFVEVVGVLHAAFIKKEHSPFDKFGMMAKAILEKYPQIRKKPVKMYVRYSDIRELRGVAPFVMSSAKQCFKTKQECLEWLTHNDGEWVLPPKEEKQNPVVVESQFTKYDGELHPECDNEDYLTYKVVDTGLSRETCSFGRKLVTGTTYRWISKAEFLKTLEGEES